MVHRKVSTSIWLPSVQEALLRAPGKSAYLSSQKGYLMASTRPAHTRREAVDLGWDQTEDGEVLLISRRSEREGAMCGLTTGRDLHLAHDGRRFDEVWLNIDFHHRVVFLSCLPTFHPLCVVGDPSWGGFGPQKGEAAPGTGHRRVAACGVRA